MMGIFSIFAEPLGWLMSLLYGLVNNYVVTIVLFTILLRLLLFPLSLRSQKMQADRARLAPRLARLQKKYGKDQQKLMEKQQELYQKEGVKMTAGCLPSIIQMLVLMSIIAVIYKPLTYLQDVPAEATTAALTSLSEVKDDEGNPVVTEVDIKNEYYRELTLLRNVENYPNEIKKALTELKGADKKPMITDVNGVYKGMVKTQNEFKLFGMQLLETPWKGTFTKVNWLWIIAILSGVTAFGTSLISMKFMKAGNPDQQPGQGCMNGGMMFMMPLMSLFISFSVPAGVGLYWILSNILSMVQTIVLNQIYNPAKIRAQAEIEYAERRRQKKEDKKRLAEARAKEEAALAAEKAEEEQKAAEKAKVKKEKGTLPPSDTTSADASKEEK